VVEHREREFGSQNVDTLRSINFLAESMTAHSKNNEVTNLYRTVMEMYSVYDGDAREEALTSADNFAQLFATQGQLAGAGAMGCWLISQRKRLLSKDHINTLINIHTLARMLFTNE
jgi:hypothetical protein